MRWWKVVLAAMHSGACVPGGAIAVPELAPEVTGRAEFIVLIAERPNYSTPLVYGVTPERLAHQPVAIAAPSGGELFAFLYLRSGVELRLESGKIDPARVEERCTRPLPEPSRALVLVDRDGELRWEDAQPNDSDTYKSFELEETCANECAMNGGCYLDADQPICVTPCPTPPSPAPPSVLTPPDLPSFLPCPDRWTVLTRPDGLTFCEPFSGQTGACPEGQVRLPSDSSCAVFGGSCPANGWPAELPPGATVLFVSAQAPPGGDGISRASAFQNIAEAQAAAPAGAVIAVGIGTYPAIWVSSAVSIIGACASGTSIQVEPGRGAYALHAFQGADLRLTDITLLGPDEALYAGYPGPVHVVLDRVALTSTGTAANAVFAVADRSLVMATDLFVRGSSQYGVLVADGSTAALDRVVLEGAMAIGLAAHGASHLSITGSLVHGQNRTGVASLARSSVSLVSSVVLDVGQIGLDVDASTLTIQDSVVLSAPTGDSLALRARGDYRAQIDLDRVRIEGFTSGMELRESSARADDIVLLPRLGSQPLFEFGLLMLASSLEMRHLFLVPTGAVGVEIKFGSRAALEDLHIRGGGSKQKWLGMSVIGSTAALSQTEVTVRRAVIGGGMGLGVAASGPARVELQDLIVEQALVDTGSSTLAAKTGLGVFVDAGATLIASRLLVRNCEGTGMEVRSVARIDLADTWLLDNRRGGLKLAGGPFEANLERIGCARNLGFGLSLEDQGLSIAANDVTVQESRPGGGCGFQCQGTGVSVYQGAQLELQGFRLGPGNVRGFAQGAEDVLATGASSLFDGEITGNEIGISNSLEDPSSLRLERVLFGQNGIQIEAPDDSR